MKGLAYWEVANYTKTFFCSQVYNPKEGKHHPQHEEHRTGFLHSYCRIQDLVTLTFRKASLELFQDSSGSKDNKLNHTMLKTNQL